MQIETSQLAQNIKRKICVLVWNLRTMQQNAYLKRTRKINGFNTFIQFEFTFCVYFKVTAGKVFSIEIFCVAPPPNVTLSNDLVYNQEIREIGG